MNNATNNQAAALDRRRRGNEGSGQAEAEEKDRLERTTSIATNMPISTSIISHSKLRRPEGIPIEMMNDLINNQSAELQ